MQPDLTSLFDKLGTEAVASMAGRTAALATLLRADILEAAIFSVDAGIMDIVVVTCRQAAGPVTPDFPGNR
jgi:hypothetical protein